MIGVGSLGQHHARLYAALPEAHLVAVVDRDGDRARLVGSRHGVPGFGDLTELPDDLEAVSVAVPTVAHAEVTEVCLARGLAVLVEKPMAPSVSEAESMAAAAIKAGRLLLVGHTERFNPAYRAVAPRLRDPRFIEAHRLGVFSARSTDIDVVLDLMIHDLDLVLTLVRAEVAAIDSVGVNALTDKVDIANARLRFENGAVANLTASRISTDRVRKLRIFESNAYLSLDYAEQSAVVYTLKREGGARPEIVRDDVVVNREEPLAVELRAFLTQIRGGGSEGVSAREGLRALRIAIRILEQIG